MAKRFRSNLMIMDASDSETSSNIELMAKRPKISTDISYEASSCPEVIYSRFIISKEQLIKLRLSRSQMENLLNLPTFERIVLNCFVRIRIGDDEQKLVYRIAEIVGVTEVHSTYHLGRTQTNKGLYLKYGTEVQVYPMSFISNREFTESEFLQWRVTCIQEDIQLPLSAIIERKLVDIKAEQIKNLSISSPMPRIAP